MRNEDALRYEEKSGVAVLADGMGGLMAGSEASKVAVEKICRHLELSAIGAANDLGAAIESAHQAVLEISTAKELVEGNIAMEQLKQGRASSLKRLANLLRPLPSLLPRLQKGT